MPPCSWWCMCTSKPGCVYSYNRTERSCFPSSSSDMRTYNFKGKSSSCRFYNCTCTKFNQKPQIQNHPLIPYSFDLDKNIESLLIRTMYGKHLRHISLFESTMPPSRCFTKYAWPRTLVICVVVQYDTVHAIAQSCRSCFAYYSTLLSLPL